MRSVCGVEMMGREGRGAVPGRAGLERLGEPRHAFDELVRDAAVGDEPRARNADLPGIAREGAEDGAGHGVAVRHVGEHHLRALAAELQRHLLRAARGRRLHHRDAGAGGPRERELADVGVPGQRAARDPTRALHDVEDAGRHAGLCREFGEAHEREGRHLGGLDDDCVAGRERRRDLPGGHDQREIPGRDSTDDAVRFRDDEAELVGAGRRHLAAELVGIFGEEADPLGRERHVPGERVTDRAGRTDGFEARQRGRVGVHEVGPAAQDTRAVARRPARPVRAGEGAGRGRHRAVDGFGRALGDMAEDGRVGRPTDRDRVFAGLDERAVDVVTEGQRHRGRIEAEIGHSASSSVWFAPRRRR